MISFIMHYAHSRTVARHRTHLAYKHFVKSCHVIVEDGEVSVISELPAAKSMESLEILDNEHHVLNFNVVGGDHRLANYRSVTTLHPSTSGNRIVVGVPLGNTKDDTCLFVDTIVRCNLVENLAVRK
ncbi:hypothetical protein V6N13_111150 [Hibiscus sabdariffa]|uniref:Uncharacterized protein n=1 Tax=Hibiscus sabdariffa TaxID=183260 RepID=A0ABR2TJA7_9ROSI